MAFSESTTELNTFLADFGVSVTLGATTGIGVKDEPDHVVEGMSISCDYVLTCKYSDFGAATDGDAITVDGVNYQVRGAARKIDDGKFCFIFLTKT